MEIGAIINDQYTVVEHIGRGGMADVWSARDQRLRRMVAIKTIAVGMTQDVDPVALFRTEAQTIASMEHPHILPIYDFGEYDGNLYIVMRFVTGGSLEDLLEQNPLPASEALRIAEAIAQALDYAHTNKIIHLDLKPPNILMDSSGSPYLADFGLATVLDPEGRARNPGSGTLLYMAPEQLTAEVIDHRADLYSFSIMIYHMLTGKLPFDGTMPLALRQLQYNDVLPSLDDNHSTYAAQLTDILRLGTAKDPANRPAKLMDIVMQMREVLQPKSNAMELGIVTDTSELYLVDAVNLETERLGHMGDPDLLEAVDIYTRARYNWAGGQGRFLVSLTHFLIMSGYYQDAHRYNLNVDEYGYQMLLRGALEFDHDLDLWWKKIGDESRRWVCLHTVRSGTTPARIRALYRLETLPDDANNSTIPKLVAQALEVERDQAARIAALQVLGSRAKLMKVTSTYQIKTEYRGRLLTTMTRLGIEVTPPSAWRDAVYSPEIDTMVAEQALDVDDPQVAEFAARTVGKMRSLVGVSYLASEQRNKREGALQALALVRDEAPGLPDVVAPQARAYAWLTNTLRRIVDKPLDAFLRFILAWLGGAIAMGEHVYIAYRSEALFTARRWGNAIAMGVVVGLFVAIMVMFADEFSARLRGFWAWWLRLLVSLLAGVFVGILAWSAFTWFYLDGPPVWDLMRMGGTGLAVGFVLVSMLNLRGWKAIALPAVLIYLPIFLENQNVCLQTYSCYTAIPFQDSPVIPAFSFFPVAGIGLLLGAVVGWLIPHKNLQAETLLDIPNAPKAMLAGLAGAVWTAVIWGIHISIYQQNTITWDVITVLFVFSLLTGIAGAFFLRETRRLAFFAVAFVTFIAFTLIATNSINGTLGALGIDYYDPSAFIAPEEGANAIVGFLQYDLYSQIFTVAIPVVLVIALGAYIQPNIRAIAHWVGKPTKHHDGRDAWLTGVLLYVIVTSGLMSVFTLFSMHKGIAYGLGWSLWGFLTFVCGLATWRWARWGARGLFLMGALMLVGGVIFDAFIASQFVEKGVIPPLFDERNLIIWGIWAIFVGVSAWGALRRQLWGGIGLLTLVIAWYPVTILGLLPSFGTIQAIANVALLAFAISPFMAEMEPNRFAIFRRAVGVKAPVVATPNSVASPMPLVTLPVAMPPAKNVLKTQLNQGTLTHPDMTADAEMPAVTPMNMNTEMDVMSIRDNVVKPELKTEMDPASQKPRIKLDTSALRPQPKPELKTEMDASSGSPATDDSQPKKPQIKFDTGSLKSKSEPIVKPPTSVDTQEESKPKPPSIKINPSLLGSKAVQKPELKTEMDAGSNTQGKDDSQPKKPQIKFDTALLKPKSDAPNLRTEADPKPPLESQPKKTGMRFDPNMLKKSTTKPTLKTEMDPNRAADADKDDDKKDE